MDSDTAATPLVVHTLESLCNELVSGRGVELEEGRGIFTLPSPASRAVFDWYRRNRSKWAGRNTADDVEAIVDRLDADAPVLPPVEAAASKGPPRVLHLKAIRAHRFAGIHRYGTRDQPPPDFEFEIVDPTSASLTIVEGNNGAGKTSLLSAITWCLTGHVYRSQRPPETAEQAVEISAVDPTNPQGGDSVATESTVSSVTPVPPADVIAALAGKPVPIDTWVELAFVDGDGNEAGTIRRAVERAPRGGRIHVTEPDFSALGLAPISREIGTRMTGLIPYIRLGDPSDLGSAVADLTGLVPLKDLAVHAEKSRKKLKGKLRRKRES